MEYVTLAYQTRHVPPMIPRVQLKVKSTVELISGYNDCWCFFNGCIVCPFNSIWDNSIFKLVLLYIICVSCSPQGQDPGNCKSTTFLSLLTSIISNRYA